MKKEIRHERPKLLSVVTNGVNKMCNMLIVLSRELLLVSMYVCVYIYYMLYIIGNM